MSRMSAPVGPSPTRLESAQLPAKAAPNTSAPMRTVALMTVSTWIQTILRSLLRSLMAVTLGGHSWRSLLAVTLGAGHFWRRSLLAIGPGGGGNVPETEGSIKQELGPDLRRRRDPHAVTSCLCAGRRTVC